MRIDTGLKARKSRMRRHQRSRFSLSTVVGTRTLQILVCLYLETWYAPIPQDRRLLYIGICRKISYEVTK
ncbi:hypothetical protein P153DRAFT_211063 [Dothidotthia symphoricarpi CBS 119687]|uniref:Uncharacterized protein n=1 Tax=Dothidotthia symphoricarpi CBS 119687 TaxID=1392245 RepID=A0A6A6AJ30_9PLEO|nr:uncharacterized protein P153DRAFT_211063 [Dothidotthia symphoricarpi CBS 119687]KAF2131105.1 hypothetical protein P153DRAFT_211063 [Dothidotthia symphoricarpi CBS 119687]